MHLAQAVLQGWQMPVDVSAQVPSGQVWPQVKSAVFKKYPEMQEWHSIMEFKQVKQGD